jgi:hypothetical protein
MILNDLFESRMSELDIEYQDYKDMSSGGFYSRYKMTKDQWAGKHWSLIKSGQTIHEGAMKDLHIELADKYQELAPKIEKYKDSFLAGQLYDALEAIAIEHGAELEFKRMMNGARNRAHMDYDTNPGGFQNWFWYLPFADEQLDEIDRRGFLKGVGAAAIAGAAGGVGGYELGKKSKSVANLSLPNNPQAYFLLGYIYNLSINVLPDTNPELARISSQMGKLHSQAKVEVASGNFSQLEQAYNKGTKVAQEALDEIKSRNNYYTSQCVSVTNDPRCVYQDHSKWIRDKNFGNDIERTIHPYYNKLMSIIQTKESVEQGIAEENQDDRNARIIAGEIEDAMSQGNEQLAKQKIKELIRVGYTLDKDGKLQRMGMYEEAELQEEQDACYRKVKSRYKVWPSAYASGALVQCRKKGAANWGNKTKK